MKLNQLAPAPGSRTARKRIGRGIGSGTGKTAGKGHKGQKSRAGASLGVFEGGQMPIYRRLPKRGFNKPNRDRFNAVNVGRIQSAIDAGKLDAGQPVTPEALLAAGVITRAFDGVRLLGQGDLKAKVSFQVHHASKSALAAVEKAGGSVTVLEARKPRAEAAEDAAKA